MRLLKVLVNVAVGTLGGALGDRVLGPWGLIVGFIAGGVGAWWVARRVFS